MTAAVRDLVIEQGSTFFLGFNWHQAGPEVDGVTTPGDPYDLTGCTARMQIRRKQGATPLLVATSASPSTPEAIAAGAGRITLGGPTGRIELTLTDEDTDKISSRSALYDIEIEWPLVPGELRPRVDRILKGTVTTDPNITQVDGEDPVVGI